MTLKLEELCWTFSFDITGIKRTIEEFRCKSL